MYFACRDEAEIATLLLKAGADPNSKSGIEHTPLTLAAIKGNLKVLSVLLECPSTRLFEQVCHVHVECGVRVIF